MPFIQNEQINKGALGCRSQEHNPPSMMVFPPEGGTWVCPVCGEKTTIPPSPTCHF